MNNFLPQKRGMQVVWIIVGCLIYAVGLNVFIIPMNLYSGGAVGLAQLLSYGAGQIGIKEIAGLNLYGIIYLLLNIPILFIAWFKIGKTFFINTILGTVGISLFTSIVPSPATAVIDDPVIGIIIGGVVTGAGIGIMLTAKGSGGGLEVIGIWMAKKYAGMSVGKLGTIFNLILYAIYLLVFDISTVIYSVVYLFFYTVTLDRMHFQNINVRMLIFTKKKRCRVRSFSSTAPTAANRARILAINTPSMPMLSHTTNTRLNSPIKKAESMPTVINALLLPSPRNTCDTTS